ncbi:MAG: sigma-70 family RNA polymerase sigma factor [Planctomycetota bacterium]
MSPEPVTQLLRRFGEGDRSAADELFPLLYDQLRTVARSHMARERADHTLQPTALVHEAWARLAGAEVGELRDRQHFLALAARAMRQILVEHARARDTDKRGGGAQRVPLEIVSELWQERHLDVLAVDEALNRLAQQDEQLAHLVELRFFGGLSNGEVGAALGVPLRSVERMWSTARAWLRLALDGSA